MANLRSHAVSILAAATVSAGALASLAACEPGDGQVFVAPPQVQTLPVPVTTLDVMLSVINPSTDVIWSLSYVEGLSEEDWQQLEHASVQLATSATLVSLGGSGPADQERARNQDWQDWSREMAALALAARRGAQSRDQTALAEAGDAMVDVCGACHAVYLPMP